MCSMEPASRFLRARKLKTRAPDDKLLALRCHLGRGSSMEDRSDAEESDEGDVNDVSIMLPPEKMEEDLRLVQEMEMDRHVWSKHLGCLPLILALWSQICEAFPITSSLSQPFSRLFFHFNPYPDGYAPSQSLSRPLSLLIVLRHISSVFGRSIDGLPRRWLPPGTVSDLYRHYTSCVEINRAGLLAWQTGFGDRVAGETKSVVGIRGWEGNMEWQGYSPGE